MHVCFCGPGTDSCNSLMVNVGESTVCVISTGGVQELHTTTKNTSGREERGGRRRRREERRREGAGRGKTSPALGQQVSVWKQGMTDASVSVPTVAALWEQCRCLLPPPPPPPRPPSLLPLDRPWCGDNKTGAVLSAVKWPHWHGATRGQGRGWSDGEVQAGARGLRRSRWRRGRVYKCGGQQARTGEGLSRWAVGTSCDVGSAAVLPGRKADVFARGCAKFAEQPSAAWRSGL